MRRTATILTSLSLMICIGAAQAPAQPRASWPDHGMSADVRLPDELGIGGTMASNVNTGTISVAAADSLQNNGIGRTQNTRVTAAKAACGAVDGLSLPVAPPPASRLCSLGTASPVSGKGPWTWTCGGTGAEAAVQCHASATAIMCPNGRNIVPCAPGARHTASWTPAAAPFKTVYYHTVQGSFWAQLADDTGPAPTPRELAIKSLSQNFKAIKALGFDTVTMSLPDNDSWPSQHGGGFSYDPGNPAAARPQFAVAQEIAVRIADARQLKVIFNIAMGLYRLSSDGRSDWSGLADEYGSTSKPSGAYDFIHCLIDSTAYYGVQSTTKLATVGIPDGVTRSFINDPRIIGWELLGEWNPNVVNPQSNIPTQERYFQKYWNFFYSLVHDQGARNAFAGTYLIGAPFAVHEAGGMLRNIKTFKHWFAPDTGIVEPDLIGLEFYGGPGPQKYDLASASADLNKMVDAMESVDKANPGDFSVAPAKIYLAEGNVEQADVGGVDQFFQDVLQLLVDRHLAGIKFFVSDSLSDSTAAGTPTLSAALPVHDLFATKYSPAGTRKYPSSLPPGISWHLGPKPGGSHADPTSYGATEDVRVSAFGEWVYTEPTDLGVWIQQAIADHSDGRNLTFYANPDPLHGADRTTLHWDLTRMPDIRTVALHLGSPSGPVLAEGSAVKTSAEVAAPTNGSEVILLIDMSTGKQRELGTVTLKAK